MERQVENITVKYSDGEIETITTGCVLGINEDIIGMRCTEDVDKYNLSLMFYAFYSVCVEEVGVERAAKLIDVCKLSLSREHKETSEGEE